MTVKFWLSLSIIGYLINVVLHIINLKQHTVIARPWLFLSALLGLTMQIVAMYLKIVDQAGLHVDLLNSSLLISAFIVGLTMLLSLRLPLEKLFLIITPVTICILLAELLMGHQNGEVISYDSGLLSHILLSILAYSTLVITTLHTLFVAWQNQVLKKRHTDRLIKKLPALQTMESVLFSLLWTGLILLTAAIVTGFFFVDNLFAQHLVHKTVLSILAWFIFAIVLIGHVVWGWRGLTVTYWIIAGFIALMLGYFGSKFVLEVILHRI